MLFKRKNKKPLLRKIKNFFWPSMGWKRSSLYIKYRAVRLNASTYAVAAGLAFGGAISWAPTLGFHILQTMLLCFIFRANYIAGLLGTLIGNPWTFPFMFLISYKLGWFLITVIGVDVPFTQIEPDLSFENLKKAPWSILTPMLLGGYTMALLTFPIFYAIYYAMIKKARLSMQGRTA